MGTILNVFLVAVSVLVVAVVTAILFTTIRAYHARQIMKNQLVAAIVLATLLFVVPLLFILLFRGAASAPFVEPAMP